MAWEKRGARRYYYSNRRVDGLVVRTYHGTGAVGELAAGLIEGARRARAEMAGALAAERARLGPPDLAMKDLDRACNLMTEAALTAAGYHRHDYRWRRRRGPAQDRGAAGDVGRG